MTPPEQGNSEGAQDTPQGRGSMSVHATGTAAQKQPVVTNETFLKTIFGKDYGRAWVAGFSQDPTGAWTSAMRGQMWAGDEYRSSGKRDVEGITTCNTFMAISVFNFHSDSRARRRKALFDRCYLVMIDDVGTKVDLADLDLVYGVEPTYRIETSPGNEQWGLALEGGEVDAWKVTQLQDGMIRQGLAIDGKDPGMKGVTRYGRLPQGVNNKAKYVRDLGRPFAHVLQYWDPEKKFTVESIAEIFGIELLEPAAQVKCDIEVDADDHVLTALQDEGLVKGELPGKPLAWDITCPWVDEHTDNDDSGAAYFSPGYVLENGDQLASGGFKCHHGHCEERTISDVRETLADAHPYLLDRCTIDEFEVADSEDAVDEEGWLFNPAEYLGDRFRGTVAPEQKWIVEGFIPKGVVGVLVAPGGTGKSRAVLQLSYAMATGTDWMGFKVKEKAKSMVLFAEDPEDDVHRRHDAVVAEMMDAFFDDAPNAAEFWEDMRRSCVVPMMGAAPRLTRKVRDEARETKAVNALIATVKAHTGCSLLTLDTLSRFRGGQENDNNDMSAFVGAMERIAKETACGVLVIHHTTKNGTRGLDASQAVARGGSALVDNARYSISMFPMTERDAKHYGLSEKEQKLHVYMEHSKLNAAEKMITKWFRFSHSGVLIPVTLTSAVEGGEIQAENDRLVDTLVTLLAAREAAGEPGLSRTDFVKEFGGVKRHPLYLTRDALRGVLDLARDEAVITCPAQGGLVTLL